MGQLKLPGGGQIHIIPEEEVKRIKDEYLSSKERKDQLLKEMGISAFDDPAETSPAQQLMANLDFDEAKLSIRDRLKEFKAKVLAGKEMYRPYMKSAVDT